MCPVSNTPDMASIPRRGPLPAIGLGALHQSGHDHPFPLPLGLHEMASWIHRQGVRLAGLQEARHVCLQPRHPPRTDVFVAQAQTAQPPALPFMCRRPRTIRLAPSQPAAEHFYEATVLGATQAEKGEELILSEDFVDGLDGLAVLEWG